MNRFSCAQADHTGRVMPRGRRSLPRCRRIPDRVSLAVVLAVLASACEPRLLVGEWTCPPPAPDPMGGSAGAGSEGKRIEVPWTTGFEERFCDYGAARGFCYATPGASYRVVDSPVRSGRLSAAFSVTSDPDNDGSQTRCFLEGALPLEATYGAWYYIPAPADNTGNWNLIHFQGRSTPSSTDEPFHNLWDVSLGTADDGSLYLYVFDALNGGPDPIREPSPTRPVPIGEWVHIEFRLRRAADATGEIALYQDGALLMEATGIVTDDSDFGQWYVGNLASQVTPSDSTLYVDDVTVRAAR